MAVGFISITCFPSLFEYLINQQMVLREGATSFTEWQKTRPLTMDIYIYNWTNPEDIYNSSIKPKFVQMGPYRFKHVREKVNITWNYENQTITYQNKIYFYYDEDSPGNYSDIVTTFNMVPWSIAHQTKDSNLFLKQGAKLALMFSKLHVTTTVRELLFEGYEDTLVSAASSFSFLAEADIPNRVGFFYGRNESVGLDGIYNVHINLDDEYGRLKNWNYNNRTTFFEDSCGEIYGSAGEFYPRYAKPDHITYFATDMCRGWQFDFERNHTIKGIPTYKYSAGKEMFDNGTLLKENKCYCKGNCRPSGVIDMSGCRMGLPIYISLPHFYNGDPSYVDAIDGLKPEKDVHEFYFALEPSLGIISDTAARIQMNVWLEPIPSYAIFENVPKVMFPIFWTENVVPIYDDYASSIRLILMLPHINKTVSMYLIILGAFCIGYVILFLICLSNEKPKKHKSEKETIPLTISS